MRRFAFLLAVLMLCAAAVPVRAGAAGEGICAACGETVGQAAYCPYCGAQNPGGGSGDAGPAMPGKEREPGEFVCESAQSVADRYGVRRDSQTGIPKYAPKNGQPLNAFMIVTPKCHQVERGERSTVEEAGISRTLESLLKKYAKAIEKESGGCIRFVADYDRADLVFTFNQRYEYVSTYTNENGQTASVCDCEVWIRLKQLRSETNEALFSLKADPPGIVTLPAGQKAFYMTSPILDETEELREMVDLALLWNGYNPSGSQYQGMNPGGFQKALDALHTRGYLADPSVNTYDDSVREAVRSLQADYSLVPTGGLDRISLTALYYGEDAVAPMRKAYLAEALQDGTVCGSCCRECGRFWEGTDYRFCPFCGSPLEEAGNAEEPADWPVPGSVVTFGHYEQDNSKKTKDAVEWIVLDVKDGKALLFSRWILDTAQYNKKDQAVTWEKCSLRSWLNRDFVKAAFTKEEQKSILTVTVPNGPEQNSSKYGTDGGSDTEDRVFLLSYAEAWKYLDTCHARIAASTPYAVKRGAFPSPRYLVNGLETTAWYLRTPLDTPDRVCYVGINGRLGGNGVTVKEIGIRPAMWVDAAALIP